MPMDKEYPIEIDRQTYADKVLPLIQSGQLKESVTGWGVTYLWDHDTGLNAGYIVPNERYWRVGLHINWAEKLDIVEVKQ